MLTVRSEVAEVLASYQTARAALTAQSLEALYQNFLDALPAADALLEYRIAMMRKEDNAWVTEKVKTLQSQATRTSAESLFLGIYFLTICRQKLAFLSLAAFNQYRRHDHHDDADVDNFYNYLNQASKGDTRALFYITQEPRIFGKGPAEDCVAEMKAMDNAMDDPTVDPEAMLNARQYAAAARLGSMGGLGCFAIEFIREHSKSKTVGDLSHEISALSRVLKQLKQDKHKLSSELDLASALFQMAKQYNHMEGIMQSALSLYDSRRYFSGDKHVDETPAINAFHYLVCEYVSGRAPQFKEVLAQHEQKDYSRLLSASMQETLFKKLSENSEEVVVGFREERSTQPTF
jgi:hypothetical protein